MGRIWANLEFELSQILESCSVWNQAGEGIESRQRQQQVAEKQLQLFWRQFLLRMEIFKFWLEFSSVAILIRNVKVKMDSMINKLHALEVENLKLIHKLNMNHLESRLKLQFDAQVDEIKSNCIAKKEFDLSELQNKIGNLE